jgi:Membrane domain of glycerophosphoryl diester phosphodiesterase
MALDLRPLTLGELLDRSFSLYRSHFRTFVAIMAVPAVLGAGFALLLELAQGDRSLGPPGARPTPDAIFRMAWPVIALWVGILFYLAVHVVAVGATTAAVSELYMGREATARGGYDRVRSRIGRLLLVLVLTSLRLGAVVLVPLILAGVVVALAVGRSGPLATIVAIILGLLLILGAVMLVVFLTLRYCLAVPAVVIESVTARQAIRRSIALMRGNLGRGFVLVLFAFVIAQITTLIFQGPFMAGAYVAGPDAAAALWLRLMGACAGALGNAISAPLMSVALALLYYDARVRHEGLDLQIMMDTLDAPSGGLTSPRASAAL